MKTLVLCIIFALVPLGANAQDYFTNFVNRIQTYQNSVEIVYHPKEDNKLKNFNLKQYMSLFDKLTWKSKRFVVGSYYYDDNYSYWRPYLYARKKWSGLPRTKNQIFRYLNKPANRAYSHVIPEESEEGYFQYLFFHEYGDLFALGGPRSIYYERFVIVSETQLDRVMAEYVDRNSIKGETNASTYHIRDSVALATARKESFSPKVSMRKDECIITLYEQEGSFYQKTFRISRQYPYSISLEEKKEIVELILGYIF
jgi:hypothetical protein